MWGLYKRFQVIIFEYLSKCFISPNCFFISLFTYSNSVKLLFSDSDHNDNLQLVSLPGVSGQSPLEAVCNSPTKIASAELSPALKGKQKDDKKTPDEQSLSAPPKESRNKKSSRKSKDRSQAEERTFTFEVGSKTASPESIVGGWKPFSVMESFDSPQVRSYKLFSLICAMKFCY